MNEALSVIDSATSILEEENSNITDGNITAVAGLFKRKEAVLARLNSLSMECKSKAPSEVCCSAEVRDAAKKLETAIELNRTLLKRAMTAQAHIIQLLTSAVTRPDTKTPYGKNGSYNSAQKMHGKTYRKNA
ncbi:flagellar protein FlgN [Acetobacter conturbans]|uniref:Flagellar protein FlgN n=1 Tax=Acetobacter conturbans TaxID=1737472 RepID=A0ABX0JZS3_9PROT|nr:flagellar protein FlgN [Acetobacter conturbans]NHN87515.1 flagellar protein FlgN [Acetobacter conturbans]